MLPLWALYYLFMMNYMQFYPERFLRYGSNYVLCKKVDLPWALKGLVSPNISFRQWYSPSVRDVSGIKYEAQGLYTGYSRTRGL